MIRLASLAPLLLALASCAPAGPADRLSTAAGERPAPAPRSAPRPPAPPRGYPAIALVFPGPGVGGADALRGRLLQSGQCLMLETPGGLVHLVFADIDVSWDPEGNALESGGRSYRLRDGIEIVGAAFAGDPEDLDWLRRPAPGCGPPFWIVSSTRHP